MKKWMILIFMLILLSIMTACTNLGEPKSDLSEAELGAESVSGVETKTEAPTITLTSLGRASIRLETSDGKVVYIDPYGGMKSDYAAEADLLLVTHQHTDHNKISLVTLKEDGVMLRCPFEIKSGTTKTVNGFEITAVDAYNENHSKSEGCGFIIKYNDIVIYHSGDTSTTEQMKDFEAYNIDYALLCMDGYYNMGTEEAMMVENLIKAQKVIPIHTSGDDSYSRTNVETFTHDSKLEVKMGESVVLSNLTDVKTPFGEAIKAIMTNRLTAIETKDYDLYMSSVTKRNPYFYNEQERWFMEMIDATISNVSFEITSINTLGTLTAVANIRQKHKMDKNYDITYPLLFRYENGEWKDYGYYFNELSSDRFKVKFMDGETRFDEFRKMLDDAYDHLDGLYKEKPHPYFEMKLFTDQEMLRQRTIPSNAWLFTGWSEPDESLKLFTGHPSNYTGYPGVVQHELVHHITIRMCNNNLAVWLLEGIAMHDGSAAYDFKTSSLLANLNKTGVTKTIAELEDIDLGSDLTREEIGNFYNTSYMYVRYISETYGHDTLMALFEEAGKKPFHDSTLNQTFEVDNQATTSEVIQTVLKISKDELSNDYLEWLESIDFSNL